MTDDTVDALELRQRLEAQLDGEANAEAQRIVDDLIREQSRAEATGDEDEFETTLVLNPQVGSTRRLHIYESDEPGTEFAAEHDEWTGCSWRPKGRERLTSVEIDGERFGSRVGVFDGP